ncbi:MAG: hypothetical protein ABW123_13855 [Cystobacter sp.]
MSEKNEEVQINRDSELESSPSTEQELTDEQLLQMAEGSCSWGANCRG